ncbi:hypothetical protein JCM2421_05650 [Staphylococcus auricularis]|uniref:conserved phage C-terminal domain-containing protein n=1 Tax=Staphylococcus auricularis TaxID=29379 RepID=UPI001932D849|nr:conserved phage C-terminal domain-containing protein [Staphylococcus auricularis]MBM0868867.1 replication protein [Staphylococcus auricularis]BCU51793.1 hypothetical protein JCM2421_05650 [Staphylococcus auricularis]
MTIFRIHKESGNFVTVNKDFINDSNLSWKAKGILLYLLSKPDDWQIYETELVKHSIDGLSGVKSGIKELEETGYIQRNRKRDSKGRLKEYEYAVYERPNHIRFSNVGKTYIGKTNVGKTYIGKSHTTNNYNTNNYDTNNDNTNNDSRVDHGAYKEIIEYLNKETDKHFNFKAKANQELIKARFNEGYEKADFFKVIDNKVSEWLDVDKMKDYLQPSTLFRKSNFDKYLNQTVKQPTKEANVLDKLMKEE